MPTAARVVAAILACSLIALSCQRQPSPPVGAVEVANASAGKANHSDVKEAALPPAMALASQTPDSPIRKIDFENFSYSFSDEPQGRKRIKLRDGEQPPTQFSQHGIPRDMGYRLRDVSYGDVTGDGGEEAIVTIGHLHSGTAINADVYVYSMKNKDAVLLWSFETGDRAEGGLQRVYSEDGELVIELKGRNKIIGTNLYADDGHVGGLCCPDAFTRTRYHWQRGRFRQKGKAEVLPIERTPSAN